MPILITCTSCGKKIKVSDTMLGRMVYCPECKAMLKVQPGAGDSHADPVGELCAADGAGRANASVAAVKALPVAQPANSGRAVSLAQMTPAASQDDQAEQDDVIIMAPLGMQTPSGLPVHRTTAADAEVQRGLANMARIVGVVMGALAFGVGIAALIGLSLEGRLLLAVVSFFVMLITAVTLAVGGTILRGALKLTADMADMQRRQQAALDDLISRLD